MRSLVRAAPAAAAAGAFLMGSLLAGPAAARVERTTLVAELTGTEEVPGPGDPDGSGTARITLRLNPAMDTGAVCFWLRVENIDLPAAAAHIHPGSAGETGPPLVDLKAPNRRGKAKGCTRDVDAADINAIIADSSAYYLNVHTTGPSGYFSAVAVLVQLTVM